MNEVMQAGLNRYLERLPIEAQAHYAMLRDFYTQTFGCEALYKDGSPVFVRGSLVVRVGLFADHANLFVRGSQLVSTFFEPSQLTPKGMVQWFYILPFPKINVTAWMQAELQALPPCVNP
jgi:hypothetical protein